MTFLFILLFLHACTPSEGTRSNSAAPRYDNSAIVGYLSTKYYQAHTTWPTSILQLKEFASTSDSLKTLCNLLSTNLTFSFVTLSNDSLQVTKIPANISWKLLESKFYVTPQSTFVLDSIGAPNVNVIVVDDTTQIK